MVRSFNCKYSCGLCEALRESFWQCGDGADNDLDTSTDCGDSDCSKFPLCTPSTLQQIPQQNKIIAATAVGSVPECFNFVGDFLNTCQNTEVRTKLKARIETECQNNPNSAAALAGRCNFTGWTDEHPVATAYTAAKNSGVHTDCPWETFEYTLQKVDTYEYYGTQKCLCDGSEMGFYFGVGMIGCALAVFLHYAGHLAIKRRRNAFEHKMCMATACVWYVLGVVPICFWMSCIESGACIDNPICAHSLCR